MPETTHGQKFWKWIRRTNRFPGYIQFGIRKLVLNVCHSTGIFRLHREFFWSQNLETQIVLFKDYLIPYFEAEAKPENREQVEELKAWLLFLRTVQIVGDNGNPVTIRVLINILERAKTLLIQTERA